MIIVGSHDADLRVKDYWFAIPSCGVIADYLGYVNEYRVTFFIKEKEPCTILACQKRGIRGQLPERGMGSERLRD